MTQVSHGLIAVAELKWNCPVKCPGTVGVSHGLIAVAELKHGSLARACRRHRPAIERHRLRNGWLAGPDRLRAGRATAGENRSVPRPTVTASGVVAAIPVAVLLAVSAPDRAGEPGPGAESSPAALTREQASAFARLALKAIGRQYPNKPE